MVSSTVQERRPTSPQICNTYSTEPNSRYEVLFTIYTRYDSNEHHDNHDKHMLHIFPT